MRVLVTGGNGFIGSTVVRKLHEKGETVRCALRKTSRLDRLQGLSYEKAVADIRDRESLRAAIRGCDAVIHCASLSNWKDLGSPELESIVVDGTRNLIELIKGTNIRMVYVSSAAALGAGRDASEIRNAESSFNLAPGQYRYAAYKSRAEQLCLDAVRHDGANIVIVNPVETYGPGDTAGVTASTLREFTSGPLCLVCKGGTAVAHVEDVACGTVAALEKGQSGKKYILGGDNVSICEMAAIAQRCAGTHYPTLTVPAFLIRGFVGLFNVIRIPALQPLLTKYRYATHYWYFDNTETLKELGVTFRSAEATIADTMQWLETTDDQ